MFVILSALILYSLLTFGAVLPNNWFLLTLVMVIAIGWCLVKAILRNACSRSLVMCLALGAALFWLTPARVAIGYAAGLLAWMATREGGETQTLRFFKVLVVIGTFEALLGLLQFFVSPGWIFGYINPNFRVSGTLINRNHYAGLLELLMPAAFGFAYIASRRFHDIARSYFYILVSALMGIALVFSVSRMGIFSLLATMLLMGVVLRLRNSRRNLVIGLGLGVTGLVVAGALWIGIDVIVQRYSELQGQDAILREGRIVVFKDAIRMIEENPFGVGLGEFQDRYRKFQTFRPELLFDHAHNDYLETTAEWGVPIAIAFWIFIFFSLVRAVRLFVSTDSPEQCGILLACIGSVFSLLVHSLTDFNLQIPSNAMLFFSVVGISLALPLPTADRSGADKYLKNA